MIDEKDYKLVKDTKEWFERIANSIGLRFDNERWVDENGEPLGDDIKQAVKRVFIRDWEVARIRRDLRLSSLPEDRKEVLLTMLNIVETIIGLEIRNPGCQSSKASQDMLADLLGSLKDGLI